jgi:glycosyltransferase involved in cell wall biosynthesis
MNEEQTQNEHHQPTEESQSKDMAEQSDIPSSQTSSRQTSENQNDSRSQNLRHHNRNRNERNPRERQPRDRGSNERNSREQQEPQSREQRDSLSRDGRDQPKQRREHDKRDDKATARVVVDRVERNNERNPKNQERRDSIERNSDRKDNWFPSISVVIPMLNEEESLPELIARLEGVLEKQTRGRYEVIFIDDGSTDSSYEIIRRHNRKNNRIQGIRFRRNYGKSAALAVAFAQARNEVVITMDADLQDDPSEIPNLVNKLAEGYDLVSGWKKKRNDPLEKRIPSKFFNAVTSFVSGIKLHDFNCGLKAYRRDVVKTVNVYGEMHRYIPALAFWEGFRIAEIPVQHHARKFGVSKFGFSRYFKGFLDLLTVVFTTRYVKRPLHLFGTLGALFALTGIVIDTVLSIEWFMNQTSLSNRPLLFMGIALIIVGVQLISIGLIGELIVKNNTGTEAYSIKEKT